MNRRVWGWAAVAMVLAPVSLVGAQTAMVAAEVVKIDKAAGRVTLKHGEIPSLDMPPMTLNWRVQRPQLLDDIQVGDRVRFAPARIDGQYTVTALSKVPA